MKRILLALIKFYQRVISPLSPPKCKYYPTCSCYAFTAIDRFGAVRGTALAAWRLLRCNPWSMGGIDHVPDKFTFKRQKFDYSTLNDEKIQYAQGITYSSDSHNDPVRTDHEKKG